MPAAAPPLSVRLRRAVRDALPTGHAWWWVLGACGVGLLLFVLLWTNRATPAAGDGQDDVPAVATDPAWTPLPAPLPASDIADPGFDYADPQDGRVPVRIDAHVPQAPAATAPVPAAETAPDAPVQAAAQDLPTSVQRPIATPQPDYPRASMRRGEEGEVVLRVVVGSNGRVDSVEIVSSSGHRRLDRAAVAAVRRWRFEPALRDGQPVQGELRIPFAFAQG